MNRYFSVFLVIAEIITFVLIARWLGIGWTILALGVCGLIGLAVAASQLRRGMSKVQRMQATGQTPTGDPTQSVMDAAARTIGSVLMVMPGFLTFIIGALFLFPPTRVLFRGVMTAAVVSTTRKFEAKVTDAMAFGGSASPFGFATSYDGQRPNPFAGTVIDAEEDTPTSSTSRSSQAAGSSSESTPDPDRRAAGNPADPRFDS